MLVRVMWYNLYYNITSYIIIQNRISARVYTIMMTFCYLLRIKFDNLTIRTTQLYLLLAHYLVPIYQYIKSRILKSKY